MSVWAMGKEAAQWDCKSGHQKPLECGSQYTAKDHTPQSPVKQGQGRDQIAKTGTKGDDLRVQSNLSWSQTKGLSRGLWGEMENTVLTAE